MDQSFHGWGVVGELNITSVATQEVILRRKNLFRFGIISSFCLETLLLLRGVYVLVAAALFCHCPIPFLAVTVDLSYDNGTCACSVASICAILFASFWAHSVIAFVVQSLFVPRRWCACCGRHRFFASF